MRWCSRFRASTSSTDARACPRSMGSKCCTQWMGRCPHSMSSRGERTQEQQRAWAGLRPRRPSARSTTPSTIFQCSILVACACGSTKGGARYSLLANPNLARALRFRARRWETPRFTMADGLVLTPESATRLMASQRLAERAYSASALAQFASCPYRFFLHAVMGVSEREQVPELDELDARQRGVLFHAVQRELLSALSERGLLPLKADGLDRGQGVARAGVLQAGRADQGDVCAGDRARVRCGAADLARGPDEWLERLTDETRWIPWRFELGFGLPRSASCDPHSREEPVLLVVGLSCGRDRPGGAQGRFQSRGPSLVRATDHKTGKARRTAWQSRTVGACCSRCCMRWRSSRCSRTAKVHAGRLYFCTSKAGFQSHDVPLNDGNRKRAQELVTAIDTMVSQGFLPAAPAPQSRHFRVRPLQLSRGVRTLRSGAGGAREIWRCVATQSSAQGAGYAVAGATSARSRRTRRSTVSWSTARRGTRSARARPRP